MIGSATRRSLRVPRRETPGTGPPPRSKAPRAPFGIGSEDSGSNVSRVGNVASAEREAWHYARSVLASCRSSMAVLRLWLAVPDLHGGLRRMSSGAPFWFFPGSGRPHFTVPLSHFPTAHFANRRRNLLIYAGPRPTPTANPNPPCASGLHGLHPLCTAPAPRRHVPLQPSPDRAPCEPTSDGPRIYAAPADPNATDPTAPSGPHELHPPHDPARHHRPHTSRTSTRTDRATRRPTPIRQTPTRPAGPPIRHAHTPRVPLGHTDRVPR